MSRLGLYLSTREYAGLLPDSRGLRDFFFFFCKGDRDPYEYWGFLLLLYCVLFCFCFLFFA